MVAYARTSGNNKERCETRGYGRLLSRTKAYQLWEETLIWEERPIIKYPQELVKFPVLLVVAANCL
jgi:hypothetical protein